MTARLLLFTGQALDAATFALAVTLLPVLIAGEQNPIVAALYGLGGGLAVAGAKIGATGLVCWALGRRRVGRLAMAVVFVAALSGFAGASSNLVALWLMLR